MASRKDVAKEAGVSAASVSYYINHNGYVSEEAGKRIQAAIDKLNYNPNQIARSLKKKDSKQFVFLCNEIRNPFFAQLVYCATQEAYKDDYFILFSNVIDDKDYLRKICSYQVSGLFFSNQAIKREALDIFLKQNVPIVMLRDIEWNNLDERITQIRIENEKVFRDITEHLRKQNYKKLCYISSARSGSATEIDEKTKSFLKASKEMQESVVVYRIADARDAFQYITEHFTKENCKDAFICSNDAVAVGVVKGIREIGLRISEDVAVVGYDNTFQSQFSVPSITSVDIGADSLGIIIMKILKDKIKGKKVADYVISPKLIIRESSCRKG